MYPWPPISKHCAPPPYFGKTQKFSRVLIMIFPLTYLLAYILTCLLDSLFVPLLIFPCFLNYLLAWLLAWLSACMHVYLLICKLLCLLPSHPFFFYFLRVLLLSLYCFTSVRAKSRLRDTITSRFDPPVLNRFFYFHWFTL